MIFMKPTDFNRSSNPVRSTVTQIHNVLKNGQFEKVGAVVLAAGRGTRLNCVDKPKVMLPIAGRPIVSYIVDTLRKISLSPQSVCLVVGFRQEVVKEYFGAAVTYAEQTKLRGTADAAFVGMRSLPLECETVLVLGGDDSAFYHPETLRSFIENHVKSGAVLSLLTAELTEPGEMGRVVRHEDGGVEVIEKEYLTDAQKQIKEMSTGTYCFNRAWFEGIFSTMPPLRKLGEYGLPTALAVARKRGAAYQIVKLADNEEWFGINTKSELTRADERMKSRLD